MKKKASPRIWQPDTAEITAGLSCALCEGTATPNDTFVKCPRCKAAHHQECWQKNGGCATRGCGQLIDPQMQAQLPRRTDPPARDPLIVPLVIAFCAIALVLGFVLWGRFGPKPPVENRLTLLLPVGNGAEGVDIEEIRRLAEKFSADHADIAGANVVLAPYGMLYDQKLVLMIIGKDPPDILLVDKIGLSSLAANNGLLSLDGLLPRLSGTKVDTGMRNGSLYGVPYKLEWLFAIPVASRFPDVAQEFLFFMNQRLSGSSKSVQ